MAKKVFVSGCYDMLHSGHMTFFEEATAYGDLNLGRGSNRTIDEVKARKTINSDAERLYMVSVLMVKDIANLIPLVACKRRVYNICDSHHLSFNELEKLICEQLNKSNVISIALYFAKLLAKVGDILGKYAPINSDKLSKTTNSHIFSKVKAKKN